MDRPLLTVCFLLFFAAASLVPGCASPAIPADPTRECDWRADPLFEVVTAGLYLGRMGPSDSIWEHSFPALVPNKDRNYSCLQQLLERGPGIIPGLEAEYPRLVAELGLERTAPPLPKTGTGVAPALVFLEPVRGRDYLIGKVAEPGWSTHDVAIIADSVWPRRSDVVRRVLMRRLATPPEAGDEIHRVVLQLVRFSKREDFEFVRARLEWIAPDAARRLRLSLLSKNRDVKTVVRALRSRTGAEYSAAAHALLQWGHVKVVCEHLRKETDAKRANGIAAEYTSFRRGDYFEWLPDDVIAVIQRAPQAWDCLPPTISPSPFNAPRDTTKDRAAQWNRPPLGGDTK